jgi:hypothetical protein
VDITRRTELENPEMDPITLLLLALAILVTLDVAAAQLR